MKKNINIYETIARHIESLPNHLEFLKGDGDISNIFKLDSPITPERKKLYRKLYSGVGNTNCYTVQLYNDNLLNVKMEYANPMGNSHYARYWLPYLYLGEALEVISPEDSHILEVTSGSAGIALSMATNKLGYETSIIVPSLLPKSRVNPIINSGSNLIKVDGYIDKCIERLREMLNTGNYYATNHSEEKSDIIIYVFSRIIAEYLSEFSPPDYAIIGLGNGTSTLATFRYLQRHSNNTKCITYHPRLDKKEYVLGLYGPNVNLRHVELSKEVTDELRYTSDISLDEVKEVFKYDTEISNLGPSSLYGIQIALELSKKVSNNTFFTIGYDKNDRY